MPEVTLASDPLTSFKGEVEQKIKDKKNDPRREPQADRPGGAWERSHCSELLPRKSQCLVTAAGPPIFSHSATG